MKKLPEITMGYIEEHFSKLPIPLLRDNVKRMERENETYKRALKYGFKPGNLRLYKARSEEYQQGYVDALKDLEGYIDLAFGRL